MSSDGANWATVVVNGQGSGQFTTIGLDGRPIRYVRMTLTAPGGGSWWSVADVRAYI